MPVLPPQSEDVRPLLEAAGLDPVFSLEPIAAEAGSRRYYRIKPSAGAPNQDSCILCVDPSDNREDFVELAAFLGERDVPVPHILAARPLDSQTDLLLLTDCGSTDLAATLARTEPGTEEYDRWYRRAIDLLLSLQALEPPPLVRARSFDAAKLMWEMDFLRVALQEVEARAGVSIPLKPELILFFRELTGLLGAAQPQVFTHRDFHARNLLVSKDRELSMVDFQDARMGLPWYDLSSLLFDPYTCPPRTSIEAGLSYYLESRGLPATRNRPLFFAQATQRLLKALGTYLHMSLVRGMHDVFFPSVAPALDLGVLAVQLGGLPDSVYLLLTDLRNRVLPAMEEHFGEPTDELP